MLRDVIIVSSIFVFTFVVATKLDMFETVVEFVEQHEQWELDEVITGSLILGACLLCYSILRTVEVSRAERKLSQLNEKLNKTNEKLQVVGQLTRHDVRNKLATVVNNLYLAKLRLSTNNETSENLETVEKTVEQITHILNFASAYEKLGVEKLSTIDLGKCIAEAEMTLGLDNVKLLNECPGLSVVADSLVMQLFYNLIHNSVTHGEKVTQIKIYPKKDDGFLKIIYEDNGIGIPEDEKEKIFQKGYGKGTGYGLYLITKICENYGWTIKETGKQGARFEITIPDQKTPTQ